MVNANNGQTPEGKAVRTLIRTRGEASQAIDDGMAACNGYTVKVVMDTVLRSD